MSPSRTLYWRVSVDIFVARPSVPESDLHSIKVVESILHYLDQSVFVGLGQLAVVGSTLICVPSEVLLPKAKRQFWLPYMRNPRFIYCRNHVIQG